MHTHFRSLLIATALVAGSMTLASQAHAAVKVGTLTCDVESGWGVILGSSRDLRCRFSPSDAVGPERYVGKISKFGVDIGYKSGGVMIWSVMAPTSDVPQGALQGSYAGATAGATVGIGANVNVLVGGLERSFALQPVSIEGNKGLNVAAGIGAVDLTYVR